MSPSSPPMRSRTGRCQPHSTTWCRETGYGPGRKRAYQPIRDGMARDPDATGAMANQVSASAAIEQARPLITVDELVEATRARHRGVGGRPQ